MGDDSRTGEDRWAGRAPADERPHAGALHEAWGLACAGPDLAVVLRGAHHAPTGRVWWWTHVLRPGSGPVVVRDHDVMPPRIPRFEIRAEGLWAEQCCETPFEHWSYGLEAFGLELDDPADDRVGDRIPVGVDLEWECAAPPIAIPGGYVQPGLVHGEVLIGSASLPIDQPGIRFHRWGTETLGAVAASVDRAGHLEWSDGADAATGPDWSDAASDVARVAGAPMSVVGSVEVPVTSKRVVRLFVRADAERAEWWAETAPRS